jgi:hypothetical protein
MKAVAHPQVESPVIWRLPLVAVYRNLFILRNADIHLC